MVIYTEFALNTGGFGFLNYGCKVTPFCIFQDALQITGGLVMTGPTGTNVNDVAVALIRC